MPPALEIAALTRRRGARAIVDAASLDLRAGEVLALLGPSGCGKSTLLRMVCGLERPDSGAITAAGRPLFDGAIDVPPEQRGFGLVVQDFALFPHLDVARNIGFGLSRMEPAVRDARVAALIAQFGLEPLARAYPHRLSGGEQQRVAIARALAPAPAVMLMDEPFSSLDAALRDRVQAETLANLRASGAAVLLVTHDAPEAMRHADRIALMREGRILQIGTPEHCYRRPVSEAAAQMLGPVNRVPAALSGGRGGALARPDAFTAAHDGQPATVEDLRFVSGRWEVRLAIAGERLVMVHDAALAPGSEVRLAVDPARLHWPD